ncbi:A1 cistron-splicing factor [Aspergillus cavernicola]|uniref:A1 cistron-splicing factor n=1 Tax=Aspergillus cavernicola TaxID=176166 RepID=A0ABR4J2S9_9EURO
MTSTPTLLLPSLPPKTLVGIDLITFTSTPAFHGIRDIPPGWHFLYTGTTEGMSLRCGGWFYIHGLDTDKDIDRGRIVVRGGGGDTQMQILIWRWDNTTESLEPLRQEHKEEGMRVRANLGAVWKGGGLFGYRSRVPGGVLQQQQQQQAGASGDEVDEEEEDGRKEWRTLTDRFSSKLLSRIIGAPRASDVDWEGRPRWVITSGSTAREDDDDIPGLEVAPFSNSNVNVNSDAMEGCVSGSGTETGVGTGTAGEEEREFSFLPVDLKMTWREGAIGRERTEAARDRSWALGEIIQRVSSHSAPDSTNGAGAGEGEAQVLGELQFTFLMGLTLMNYSCLQQWKRLLGLILTCRRAIVERASLMADILRLLLLQLQRCDDIEGGLFDQLGGEGGGEGGDFLRKLLRGFRTALYEEVEVDRSSPVKTEFERLEAWVKSEFDWELNRDAVLRKGMLQLEDGEEVEMEVIDEDDDYAPVIVDLDTMQEGPQ